jgi:aspartyl-tRNA(Asn)/glutamyl-tRNA(Gln) amidotransferase subunit C
MDIKDVEYVAKLARLEFNDEEKKNLVCELNRILKYVEKLSEVDTDGVEASICSYPVYNALREDEIIPSMDRDKLLKGAPDEKNGYFKVPKVIG